jgi:hypothetical protein
MNRPIVRLSLGASILVVMAVVSIATAEADDHAKPQVSVPKADDKAGQILSASHDYVSAHSVEIEQTVEQTARVLVDDKPLGSEQATKQTSRIEIDANKGLVRMITKDQSGKDLVVIRKGDRIAMKIGSDPWTAPKGLYAQIGDQLANPFVCPLPKPGLEHSPRWTIVGEQRLDGQEMTVIKTVGDTANKYAQERMRDGIASLDRHSRQSPAARRANFSSQDDDARSREDSDRRRGKDDGDLSSIRQN